MTTKRTNRSPQKPKASRSIMTRDMILNMPQQTVPSGKAYKRPKAGARVDRFNSEW